MADDRKLIDVAPDKKTSRSIVLTGHGGYHNLKVLENECPEPADNEVIVAIKVCGLNFAELMARQGLYDRLPKPPVVMGLEGSGVIYKAGKLAGDLRVGDRVICLRDFGLWTEYACVEASHCFKMPDGMSFEEGAAIPVNYVTAHMMLFDFGNLRKNKSVLVHMAAGGVGIAATQLCKTVPNVTVFGTASEHKHSIIKEEGVTHPIDYRTKDYVEEILKISPSGVDIVLDPLSGSDSSKGFNLLKPMGRIIHFGAANMVHGENRSIFKAAKTWWNTSSVNPLNLMSQNKAVCGFHMGHLSGNPGLIAEVMYDLIDLYKNKKIKPKIDSVWPFEQVGRAMAVMHERKNIGKVLLSPEKQAEARVDSDDTIEEAEEGL